LRLLDGAMPNRVADVLRHGDGRERRDRSRPGVGEEPAAEGRDRGQILGGLGECGPEPEESAVLVGEGNDDTEILDRKTTEGFSEIGELCRVFPCVERCVPHARRLVIGRGDDAGAVRAERRCPDRALMLEGLADGLTRCPAGRGQSSSLTGQRLQGVRGRARDLLAPSEMIEDALSPR
jgi:hypothetical protein